MKKNLVIDGIAVILYMSAILVLRKMPMEGVLGKVGALMLFAHMYLLAGETIAQDANTKHRMWQSFAVYILIQTLLIYGGLCTALWGQLLTAFLFIAIGGYHTYLLDETKIFADEYRSDENQPVMINPNRKYNICGALSAVALFVAFVW